MLAFRAIIVLVITKTVFRPQLKKKMNSSQNCRLLILTRNLRRPLSYLPINYIVLWMKIDNSSYHGKIVQSEVEEGFFF